MEKNKVTVTIVFEDNAGDIYEKPYVCGTGVLPCVGESVLIRKACDKATVETYHAVVTDVLHSCYMDADGVNLEEVMIYTEPNEAE